MIPISGVNGGGVQPLTAAEKILGAPRVQKPEEESRPMKPVMDEYVPEEKQEPSGRYWLGKDQDGQPKVFFDDPEREAPRQSDGPEKSGGPEKPEDPEKSKDAPEDPDKPAEGPEGPKKKGKEERCVCNTDKVDREIEKLNQKKQELEQRINTEQDETKRQDLEKQLDQVERELSQKDNDTYRRQHSTFTQLS